MSEEATLDEFSDTTTSQDRQETPIGELPTDWGIEWLNDVVEINPDGFSEEDWPSETFEYISLSEASDGEIEDSQTTPLEDAPSRAQRTVQQGDVLVGTVRPKQRSHGFVSEEHDGKICSSGFGVLRPETRLNSRYLLQEILSNRFFSQMEAYVAGSGYPAVKISDLKKHRVAIPPLPEQREIATVLYTVDRAIEKTDEVIQQLVRLKNGILNEIFNRGLNESGSLRPSPEDFPESYDEVGRYQIPTEWRVANLQELCSEKITYGIVQAGPHIEDGVPYIKTGDITDGVLNIEELSRTTSDIAEDYDRSELRAGELVVTIRATVGVVVQVPPELDGANLTQGTARISLNDDVDNRFLLWAIRSNSVQSMIDARLKGTTFNEITLGQLRKVPIPYPENIAEQKRIADRLDKIAERSESEQAYLESLKRFKRGLMQDLLSGTVRTTDTNIEVPDEIAQHG